MLKRLWLAARRESIHAPHRNTHPKIRHRSIIDSTGLQVHRASQWLEAKHGAKSRRKWRKLHLVVDADSGMSVAQTLTD
jgi:RNA:NAD 2'-phosphotransferase (TPT1/KptA family)